MLLFCCTQQTRSEGWEAFPTAKVTNEHYALAMQSEQHHQQQPLSFQSCYGPNSTAPGQQQYQQQQYGRSGSSAYPSVPVPAATPMVVDLGGSSSGGGGGSSSGPDAGGGSAAGGGGSGSGHNAGLHNTPGVNPGVIAGAALMRGASSGGSGLGLGALVVGGGGSSSHQQYHASYHQHPGLPTSAPSGTQSDILQWDPPQWLPDRCVDSIYLGRVYPQVCVCVCFGVLCVGCRVG